MKKLVGYTKIGRVSIGNNVFIEANSTILPNVSIGENSVIGANSIITKNVPKNCCVAGNPAKIVWSIEDFKLKNEKFLTTTYVFNRDYVFGKGLTNQKKNEMIDKLQNNFGYID